MSNPIVLDLSHWQADPIDWNAIKRGGTLGVILKATQGVSYIDPTFFERASAAVDAGLYVTGYHFLENDSVSAQMSHYCETIDGRLGAPWPRAVIDYEDLPDPADSPTLQHLVDAVEALKERCFEVAVYSGHKIKEDLGSDYVGALFDTALWIAQYTEKAAPTWPKQQWPVWSLWQYTDKASVEGITGPVDGNRWNGDPEKLEDWFYAPDDDPLAKLPDKHVYVSIEVPEGVTVSVVVNGAVNEQSSGGNGQGRGQHH